MTVKNQDTVMLSSQKNEKIKKKEEEEDSVMLHEDTVRALWRVLLLIGELSFEL